MSKSLRSQAGATMLEFALVAALFFSAVFATFEITRYLSINAALAGATQIASSYASKVSCIDEDLRKCNDTACVGYQRILDARQRIQGVVRKTTASVVGYGAPTDPTRSSTNLTRYKNIDFLKPDWSLQVNSPDILDVLVLRPGDAAVDMSSGKVICHPGVRPPDPFVCSNPSGLPYLPTYQWKEILEVETIIVGLDSDYKSLFPLDTIFSLALNLLVTDAYALPTPTPTPVSVAPDPKVLKIKSEKKKF